MQRRSSVLILLGALYGCNPFSERSGDKSAASAAAEEPRREPRVVPRAESAKVLELAVGQWTRHKITESNGRFSAISYKVVAKEGAGFWLEVVTGAANAGTVIQVLLELKQRSDPESSMIAAARVKMPNGIVKDVRGPMLDATREGYKKALRQVFVSDLSALPAETVSVPAGRFEGCFRETDMTAFAGIEVSSTIWRHPAVPITSLVKSVAESGGTTIELVDYGLTGAKSQM